MTKVSAKSALRVKLLEMLKDKSLSLSKISSDKGDKSKVASKKS